MPKKYRQRQVCVRVRDQWVLKFIDKIVSGKKKMGIETSFSYELIRLVKSALLKEIPPGIELDRAILLARADPKPEPVERFRGE